MKKSEETRATFIVQKDRLEQLKAIAYWDRSMIKETHDAALKMYIDSRKDDLPKVLVNRKRHLRRRRKNVAVQE